MDSSSLDTIISAAEKLQSRYDDSALQGLFEAEYARLSKEKALTLGFAPVDFVKGALDHLGDQVFGHQALIKSVVQQAVVTYVIDYLVSQNVIAISDISRDQLIVAALVAMVLNAIYKQWEVSRGTSR